MRSSNIFSVRPRTYVVEDKQDLTYKPTEIYSKLLNPFTIREVLMQGIVKKENKYFVCSVIFETLNGNFEYINNKPEELN